MHELFLQLGFTEEEAAQYFEQYKQSEAAKVSNVTEFVPPTKEQVLQVFQMYAIGGIEKSNGFHGIAQATGLKLAQVKEIVEALKAEKAERLANEQTV